MRRRYILLIVLIFKVSADSCLREICPVVKPCLSVSRRQMELVAGCFWNHAEQASTRKPGIRFRVPLFDHAKSTKLTLWSIKVAMVVCKQRHKLRLPHVIKCLDSLDHVNREGQFCNPWFTGSAILKIKLCGGSVLIPCLRTHVVSD